MKFNNWIVGVIKEQIEIGKDHNVNFQRSILKLYICKWLHNAWKNVEKQGNNDFERVGEYKAYWPAICKAHAKCF